MKEIKVKFGKWRIEKNSLGNYDCKYYEYYSMKNEYKLISTDENCTKEYVEETFNISLEF